MADKGTNSGKKVQRNFTSEHNRKGISLVIGAALVRNAVGISNSFEVGVESLGPYGPFLRGNGFSLNSVLLLNNTRTDKS